MRRRIVPLIVAPVVALTGLAVAAPATAEPEAQAEAGLARDSLRPPLTRENFYFVMTDRFRNADRSNDRGGLTGGREVTGYDPTKKGWFHGGDLKGLISELDYIQGLGTTTIWLTPSFKNKPVQGQGLPYVSAGYHGYWVTDFTQIDPHLGTNDELRQLIDTAHSRGMKIFFDIITNHTADVNKYREEQYSYVSKAEEPYRDARGRVFDDRAYAGTNRFPDLSVTRSFPYTPYVPAGEPRRTPAWLNDLRYYHNRGDTTFEGENSLYGDFFGLDDLFTEHPDVVRGMQEVYDTWIRDFGVDGFRIDTMKHVNLEFWQQFLPHILATAKASGTPDFYAFGEAAEQNNAPFLSKFTTRGKAQGVLDFTFQQQAREFAGRGAPTTQMGRLFYQDDWYTDADSNAYQLPTFLGNHDAGRIGYFLREDTEGGSPESELLRRDRMAHALMYFSRGNPVVYYGDEQGFTGAGGDQAARQDMGPSVDKEYNNRDDDEPNPDGTSNNDGGKNNNIGSNVTPMVDNFDRSHPLYRTIAELAAVTKRYPALRDGAQQLRYDSGDAGILAFSRTDRTEQVEHVAVFNNAEVGRSAKVPTYSANMRYDRIYGDGPAVLTSGADGAIDVTVGGLSSSVYRAAGTITRSAAAPAVSLSVSPTESGRPEVRAEVRGASLYQASFYVRAAGTTRWTYVGTDDNAPYRVFPDMTGYRAGVEVELLTVVKDNAGHTSRATLRTRVPR